MFTITSNTIFLTRGDNAEIALSLKDEKGNAYTVQDGDKIVFRLKKQVTRSASKILIEKEALIEQNGISFFILPEDTIPLDFGGYRYEIELITVSNEHYTVVADSAFEIGKEIENHV